MISRGVFLPSQFSNAHPGQHLARLYPFLAAAGSVPAGSDCFCQRFYQFQRAQPRLVYLPTLPRFEQLKLLDFVQVVFVYSPLGAGEFGEVASAERPIWPARFNNTPKGYASFNTSTNAFIASSSVAVVSIYSRSASKAGA